MKKKLIVSVNYNVLYFFIVFVLFFTSEPPFNKQGKESNFISDKLPILEGVSFFNDCFEYSNTLASTSNHTNRNTINTA